MFRAYKRHNLWIVAVVAFSAICAAIPINAQVQLTAVAVHGDGVDGPRIVATDTLAATCLYGFTYAVGDKQQFEAPFPVSKQVTLSFVTVKEWADLKAKSADVAALDVVRTARFHTRIYLAPPGQRPHVAFQKPTTEGFVGRMQLATIVEPFLAARQIPTSMDAAGRPHIGRFSEAEVDSMRGAIRQNVRPSCASM